MNEISLSSLQKDGTGGISIIVDKIIRPYKFGKFIVDVELTASNKFLGIRDIKIDTDFMNIEQRLESSSYFDDSEYYKEEDDK